MEFDVKHNYSLNVLFATCASLTNETVFLLRAFKVNHESQVIYVCNLVSFEKRF